MTDRFEYYYVVRDKALQCLSDNLELYVTTSLNRM